MIAPVGPVAFIAPAFVPGAVTRRVEPDGTTTLPVALLLNRPAPLSRYVAPAGPVKRICPSFWTEPPVPIANSPDAQLIRPLAWFSSRRPVRLFCAGAAASRFIVPSTAVRPVPDQTPADQLNVVPVTIVNVPSFLIVPPLKLIVGTFDAGSSRKTCVPLAKLS